MLPENVFVPVSVVIPLPVLINPPVPDITPPKLEDVWSPPAVSVPPPSVTFPVPAREPMLVVNPAVLKTAPVAMLTRDADGPEAALPSASVPPLMSVLPLNEFAPLRVSVPVPVLVMPPVPPMEPLKVVDVFSPPAVRRTEPSEMVPAPANEPMVSLKLLRSSVVPADMVTAVVAGRLFKAPTRNVPALMVVVPV